jgi:hypothetical protein
MARFLILAAALLAILVGSEAHAARRQRVVQKQVVVQQRQRVQRVVVQQVVVPHIQQFRVQQLNTGHCDAGVLQLNGGGCSQFFIGH